MYESFFYTTFVPHFHFNNNNDDFFSSIENIKNHHKICSFSIKNFLLNILNYLIFYEFCKSSEDSSFEGFFGVPDDAFFCVAKTVKIFHSFADFSQD